MLDKSPATNEDILKKFKGSIILLQGNFEEKFFDFLVANHIKEVFVMEGRPSLESAEYSCKELIKRHIHPTLIADNMAGFLFFKELVKEVWLSYQIVDEEDGALCEIGALILGVLGKKHNIPVNIFPSGKKMNLLGHEKEIFHFKGFRVAPPNIKGYVPLVEWLPKKYITYTYDERTAHTRS